jgi:hypothetical protein
MCSNPAHVPLDNHLSNLVRNIDSTCGDMTVYTRYHLFQSSARTTRSYADELEWPKRAVERLGLSPASVKAIKDAEMFLFAAAGAMEDREDFISAYSDLKDAIEKLEFVMTELHSA